MPKPTLRLRELMYAKYGEAKFALGCEIVSRWMLFSLRARPCLGQIWTAGYVLDICNLINTSPTLTVFEGEALRKLFGLPTTDDLYTKNTQ